MESPRYIICQDINIKDVHHQVDLLDGFEFSSLGKLSVSLYVQTFNDGWAHFVYDFCFVKYIFSVFDRTVFNRTKGLNFV